MRQKNHKGFQMSFGWLFGIIAGAFILFLAIYAVTKVADIGGRGLDAKIGKELGVLLNPLETGFESSSSTKLSMPAETRIYSRCDRSGVFGKQLIQVSQKNFNKWSEDSLEVAFENKFIFSENVAEAKHFYVFSKPFEFPFKISDLIYLTSIDRTYCFVNAPEEIQQEINNTGQENFVLQNCEENHVKVCFGSGNCDIKVNYNAGIVEKSGTSLSFQGDALMYAAIFSNPELYECQIIRLMKRLSQLAEIYSEKAVFISEKCDSNLNLAGLINSANSLTNSIELRSMGVLVDDIKNNNDNAMCSLW